MDTYLHKHLARDNLFVPCKNEDCRFGFYLKDIKEVRDDKCAVRYARTVYPSAVTDGQTVKK